LREQQNIERIEALMKLAEIINTDLATLNNQLNTDSIEELAKFWDSHDLTDFEYQLQEVTDPVFERKKVVQMQPTEEDIFDDN